MLPEAHPDADHYVEICYHAMILDSEEEYAERITDHTAKIATHPDDYILLNNRGLAHYETGNLQAALNDFSAACNIAPHKYVPLLNRADVLTDLGRLDDALESARLAVNLDPENDAARQVFDAIYKRIRVTT